jgi:hypothetical protein
MKKGMKNQSSLQKSEMGAYGCNRCASHYECIVFDDIRGAPFDKCRVWRVWCQILIYDYFDWNVGAENACAELWTLPLSYFAELCSH